MKTLYTVLKEKRVELGLSLRDASKVIGISHSYLSTLEKGIDPRNNAPIKPTPETLQLISKAYSISYDELMALAGYIESNHVNDGSTWSPDLNDNDKKDIEKTLSKTMEMLEEQEGLMLSGNPVDDEDWELLKAAIQNGLEYAKKMNKQKYTPKKYRK